MNILIVPHPDDEIIYAFHLLKTKKIDLIIYYSTHRSVNLIYDMNENTQDGIDKVVRMFKIKNSQIMRGLDIGYFEGMLTFSHELRMDILKDKYIVAKLLDEKENTVYLPSPVDRHPTHIFLSLVFSAFLRNCSIIYYSSEGYISRERTEITRVSSKEKQKAFRECYPEQYNLMKKQRLSLSEVEYYEKVR